MNQIIQNYPGDFNITGKKRFKIAVSFPGEYRNKVDEIVRGLADIFSEECILYDHFHRAEFARPNLDTYLQNLYKNESELIVVFICADYNKKAWCGLEWRAIRSLLNSKGADDRILFVKCGEGAVDGVFNTVDGYIDSTHTSTDDIIKDIICRYNLLIEKINLTSPKFTYNIILLDDVQEQLDMLKGEIQALVDSDSRYRVSIFTTTRSTNVIVESENSYIDVFVLDVVRKSTLPYQTGQFDYFGYDLYKLLVTERTSKPKFFVLSRLPIESVQNDFRDADITYLEKQKTSNSQVAQRIKEYLDSLYMKENAKKIRASKLGHQ